MQSLQWLVWWVAIGLLWAACTSEKSEMQETGREGIQGGLQVHWAVLENSEQGNARLQLRITNQGGADFGAAGWALYFNLARMVVPETISPAVEIRHINGDFYRLTPSGEFPSLPPGTSAEIEFEVYGSIINEDGGPAGFYLVKSGETGPGDPEVIEAEAAAFLRPEQTRRGPADRVEIPTPESRFSKNEALTLLPAGEVQRILPTPLFYQEGSGSVNVSASVRIHFDEGLDIEADYLAGILETMLGARPAAQPAAQSGAGIIRLRTEALTGSGAARPRGAESYRLTIGSERGIDISGSGEAGVFYGIQSLRALLVPSPATAAAPSLSVPEVTIEDAPQFAYRGMHLDVARNFQSPDAVKKLLELMAFYKLNRFHFHLTDDEGWRLAIDGLPELTEVGGRRGHTLDEADRLVPSFGSGPHPDPAVSHGSGYYSREEFTDILSFATARHIQVIPEFDVPGHARAAIKAMDARFTRLMEQGNAEAARSHLLRDPEDESEYRSIQGWTDNVINVCQDSSYRFLETVIDDVIAMFREAGAPLEAVHIGGDEVPRGVWERSPACNRLIEASGGRISGPQDLSNYFLGRVSDLLTRRNLITAGWEEIALQPDTSHGEAAKIPNPEFLTRNFRAYVWNSIWGSGSEENLYRLANAGYQVVVSSASNLYFDLAYYKDPEEPGQYWADFVDTRKAWEFTPLELYRSASRDLMGRPIDPSRYQNAVQLTETGRRNILGIQGQLWSETVQGPEAMEYAVFPKLLGLAERAWSRPSWEGIEDRERRRQEQEAAWNRFANVLGQRELARLDRLGDGVRYRLPLPGAVIEQGQLKAGSAFPGLAIRYSTDGSEPGPDSPLYSGPVAAAGEVKLKTFDTRGRGSRTSSVVP